jgi:hypothetical protein
MSNEDDKLVSSSIWNSPNSQVELFLWRDDSSVKVWVCVAYFRSHYYHVSGSRGSSVSIGTRLLAGRPVFDSRQGN